MDHSVGSGALDRKKTGPYEPARPGKPISGFSGAFQGKRPAPSPFSAANDDVWGFEDKLPVAARVDDKPPIAERVDARLKEMEDAHARAVEGSRAPKEDAEILARDPVSQVHEKNVTAYGDGPVYSERSSMPGKMEHRTEPPFSDPIESHVRIDGTWIGGLSRR